MFHRQKIWLFYRLGDGSSSAESDMQIPSADFRVVTPWAVYQTSARSKVQKSSLKVWPV